VILARDASKTQTTKITGILEHRDIPSVAWWTREELGRALGHQPLSAVALTQPAFAASFLEKLEVARGPTADSTTDEEEDQRHAG
jgi:ribosomal protein L7Ae-like RNA K-turn-binding protein